MKFVLKKSEKSNKISEIQSLAPLRSDTAIVSHNSVAFLNVDLIDRFLFFIYLQVSVTTFPFITSEKHKRALYGMSVIYLTLALILNRKGVGASYLGNHGSATGESVVQSPFYCLLWSRITDTRGR